jgi:hypothetical protein
VLVLDEHARPRRLHGWGGPGEERSRSLTVDAAGVVTLAGRFQYRFTVEGFTADAVGGSDGYVLELVP